MLLHQLDGCAHLLAAGPACTRRNGNRLPLRHCGRVGGEAGGREGERATKAAVDFMLVNVLEGKAVVLVMESWASEMAFSIRFLLACLAGGRVGLKR